MDLIKKIREQLRLRTDFWKSCMINVYEDKIDAIFKEVNIEDSVIFIDYLNSKFTFDYLEIELEIWDTESTGKDLHLFTIWENITGKGSFRLMSDSTLELFDLELDKPIKVYYENGPEEY